MSAAEEIVAALPPETRELIAQIKQRRKRVMHPATRVWLERTDLTARELACLVLASEGATYKDTAKALRISEETVKSHMKQMRAKLGARNTLHAVAIGFRKEILQ